MTPKERGSIENAIWLCSNCSIDIDRDHDRHTITTLKEWKSHAEHTARLELGKKLPSKSDAIDTLAAALTGYPKNFLANAISNTHKATEKSLESIDPRFLIKTIYDGERTSFGIYAREDVPISMEVDAQFSKEFIEKYNRLVEHGEELSITSDAITLKGSNLFEYFFEDSHGAFTITPTVQVQAVQKIWLKDDHSAATETFDDIKGMLSAGSKSFGFEGYSFDKILKLGLKMNLDQNNSTAKLNISLELSQWEEGDLGNLPYFDKLFSIFSKMASGWRLYTSMEIKGNMVFTSHGLKINDSNFVLDSANFLNY